MTGNIQFFRIDLKERYPSSLVAHINRVGKNAAPDTARTVRTPAILLSEQEEAAKAFLPSIRKSRKGTSGGRRAREAMDCLFVAPPRFGPDEWPMEKLMDWARGCDETLRKIVGPESIIATCALHMDETAPHVHAVVIPRANDGAHGWTKRQREFCIANGIPPPTSRKTAKKTYGPLQDFIYEDLSVRFKVLRGKKGSKARHEEVDRARAAELTVIYAQEQLARVEDEQRGLAEVVEGQRASLREKLAEDERNARAALEEAERQAKKEQEEERRRFNEEQKQMRELQERALGNIYAQVEEQDEALRQAKSALQGTSDELRTTEESLQAKKGEEVMTAARVAELERAEKEKAERVKRLEADEERMTKPLVDPDSFFGKMVPQRLTTTPALRGGEEREDLEGTIRRLKAELITSGDSNTKLRAERDAAQGKLKGIEERHAQALEEARKAVRGEMARELSEAKSRAGQAEKSSADRKTLLDQAEAEVEKQKGLADAAHARADYIEKYVERQKSGAYLEGKRAGWAGMTEMVTKLFLRVFGQNAKDWLEWDGLKRLFAAGRDPTTTELPDVSLEVDGTFPGQRKGPGETGGPPR